MKYVINYLHQKKWFSETFSHSTKSEDECKVETSSSMEYKRNHYKIDNENEDISVVFNQEHYKTFTWTIYTLHTIICTKWIIFFGIMVICRSEK